MEDGDVNTPTEAQLDRMAVALAAYLDDLTRRLDAPYMTEAGRTWRLKTRIKIDKEGQT
jgi:hypothetical protein